MNSFSSEPADDDARFAAWLRENHRAAPLPDAGFSARVVAALPPPRSAFSWRAVWACVIGTIGGLLCAFADGAEWPTLATLTQPVAALAAATSDLRVAILAVIAMAAALTAAVIFALRDEDQSEPLA